MECFGNITRSNFNNNILIMAKEIIEADVKSNIGEVADELERAADNTEKLDEATKKGARGFKGVGNAVRAVGTALKAAGIGIIVGLLAKLMEVFSQNQKVVDTFNIGMEMLTRMFLDLFTFLSNNIGSVTSWFKSIFDDPLQSLKDFGQAIKDNLIERFNSLLETMGFLASAVKKLFAGDFKGAIEDVKEAGKEMVDVYTGVDNTVDKVTKTVKTATEAIVDYTKSTYDAAKANVELKKTAEIAAALNQEIIEQKDREAEQERQIRDDVTKTMEVRMEASKKLLTILDEQEKAMLKNADAILAAAESQFKLTGLDSDYVAVIQARAEKAGVLAQIEGLRTEQKMADISLTQEQIQLNKDATQLAIDNAHAQLEAYSALAGALSGLAGENKALAVAQAIIDTYVGANKAFAQGGTIGFITAAAVVAAGLTNVRMIMQTDVGSGGGGGSVAVETPAPEMMSGAFTLNGGQQQDVARAYVVSDDITNNQDKLAMIRRRATI